jgi:hypothetical protein
VIPLLSQASHVHFHGAFQLRFSLLDAVDPALLSASGPLSKGSTCQESKKIILIVKMKHKSSD